MALAANRRRRRMEKAFALALAMEAPLNGGNDGPSLVQTLTLLQPVDPVPLVIIVIQLLLSTEFLVVLFRLRLQVVYFVVDNTVRKLHVLPNLLRIQIQFISNLLFLLGSLHHDTTLLRLILCPQGDQLLFQIIAEYLARHRDKKKVQREKAENAVYT